ncbi:MAG: tRNA lysidine(34) synthetase TilS, partial [Verrucomicrobiota bacterium]
MTTSLKSMIQLLQRESILPSGLRLGLGLSGGIDSMVLAHSMYHAGIEFRALHFNHNWRGKESRQDQEFVRQWCQEHHIAFTTRTWQRPVKSEAAARQARHSFFRHACDKYQMEAVVLAHHRDDLAETFLLQLLRGSGPEGLASLLPEREIDGLRLIRPLLEISRAELYQIAKAEKLKWREDTSNTDESFARNKIRRRILPYLQKNCERDPLPLLSRTADILAGENHYWEELLPDTLPEKLPVTSLRNHHIAYQRRLLRVWLLERTGKIPSYDEIEAVR